MNFPVPSSCQEIDSGRHTGIARTDVAFARPLGLASCAVDEAELRALLDSRKPTRLDVYAHVRACESCRTEFARLKLEGHLGSRAGELSERFLTFLSGVGGSKRASMPSFAVSAALVLTFFALIWTATNFTIRNRS